MSDFNITARWVFPVSGPPLERGVLMVSDGRVVAAAQLGRVTPDIDFGNAAIVPGFVNAHTHLDLTGAREKTPPTADFTAWLRSVIAYRKTRTAEQVDADIQVGIAQCLRHGTTTVYDISVDGRSFDFLPEGPIGGTVFREIRGLSAEHAELSFAEGRKWVSRDQIDFADPLDDPLSEPFTESEKRMRRLVIEAREIEKSIMLGRQDGAEIRRALSPHAPYSVRRTCIQEVFEFSRRWQPKPLPLATHLAESPEELDFLQYRSGPFVSLQELGVRDLTNTAPSAQAIVELADDKQEVLFVHCNYLSPETPIPPKCSIVYCPRTHAAFGHSPHPFREFLNRGVRIRLGTDSLASNPDLSMLAEARFIASRHPDFDRATLLDICTGRLTPGAAADFAVVALPDRDEADPHELLFNSELPVQSTWFRGDCVFKLASQ